MYIRDIKHRETKLMAEIPPVLLLNRGDLRDSSLDSSQMYMKLLMRLEHLQNLFFLERLLQRSGKVDAELLSVSFEMVSTTLIFWTNKDRLSTLRTDFEWLVCYFTSFICHHSHLESLHSSHLFDFKYCNDKDVSNILQVMAYAAPGGGILSLELLKPTFQDNHNEQNITRSKIIQQLSLLVGFLDWVGPSAPNADLCAACKTVVQRVLDQTLNGPVDTPPALDGLGWTFPTELDFNFDLLDTFDWMRPG